MTTLEQKIKEDSERINALNNKLNLLENKLNEFITLSNEVNAQILLTVVEGKTDETSSK